MIYSYHPKGVCSREMLIELDDEGKILDFSVIGGCNGNLKAIGALVKGMPAQEAISKLKGILCGPRSTSCPDQFAIALEKILAQKELPCSSAALAQVKG